MKQNDGSFRTVLINYSVLEPIRNFTPTTAGEATAWNAAGEAAKIAVDDSWF